MRTDRLKLRLSAAERDSIDAVAAAEGLPRSDYLRRRIWGRPDPPPPTWPEGRQERGHVIDLSCSTAERERIEQAAEAAGIVLSEYIRARVWGRPPAPRPLAGVHEPAPVERVVVQIPAHDATLAEQVAELLADREQGSTLGRLVEDTGRRDDEVMAALGYLVGAGAVRQDGEVWRATS